MGLLVLVGILYHALLLDFLPYGRKGCAILPTAR